MVRFPAARGHCPPITSQGLAYLVDASTEAPISSSSLVRWDKVLLADHSRQLFRSWSEHEINLGHCPAFETSCVTAAASKQKRAPSSDSFLTSSPFRTHSIYTVSLLRAQSDRANLCAMQSICTGRLVRCSISCGHSSALTEWNIRWQTKHQGRDRNAGILIGTMIYVYIYMERGTKYLLTFTKVSTLGCPAT